MKREDIGVYLAAISHLRPANVPKLQTKTGELTWYVGHGEGEAYERMGAKHVIESGGLCESRNRALTDGWEYGLPVVEVSDDLGTMKLAFSNDGAKNEVANLTFSSAVEYMRRAASEHGAMLVGTAPTTNKLFFNAKKLFTHQGFIVGDFILVHQCGLLFDTNLKLKEDYDYTMQHLTAFGRVARCNALLVGFSHRTNDGGACAYRNPEREQEAIAYLRAKWGAKVFRTNPKRANEVIMDLKGWCASS